MTRPAPDRVALLDALAGHVLRHGLNTASLRPMAAAVQTSDRMLIYHFGNKDGLIRALLQHVSDQIEQGLSAALPPTPFATEADLVRTVVGLMRSPGFQPHVRLWFDIVSASAQGQTAHRQAGQSIVTAYLDWVALRHPQGRAGAARSLTLVEGILLMDAVGRSDVADATLASLSP